ncbi:hypothetical protein VNO78_06456 [Psophocarpus tetragonolobus]|uniref:Uncharacterized protein n=1 Tax=Psophocarpus tetragonolobus TaxID=3891 RepID=A0AAN9SUA6_PSOTE
MIELIFTRKMPMYMHYSVSFHSIYASLASLLINQSGRMRACSVSALLNALLLPRALCSTPEILVPNPVEILIS